MIVETSALVAILVQEDGYEGLVERIHEAAIVAVGAHALVETAMVLTRQLRKDPRMLMEEFLRDAEIEVVPLEAEHWRVAVGAFLTYGKGRHPARLNFGDCLSYAIAKVAGMPLLFTGEDFAKTDLGAAS